MRAAALCILVLVRGAAVAAPALRLADDARPTRYAVALTIDPRADELSGVVDLQLDVRRSVDTLWLDAEGLAVQRASLTSGSKRLVARVIAGQRHVLGFAFAAPLPLGPAQLHVEYRAPLSTTETTGVTRQHEGADDYVITQLAPIEARRAFPCFDEPGYKVPWQLTLTVPTGDRAFSNTRPVAERDLGGGRKRVEFAETPPLPSYLLAFAVGPFDVVDAGRSSMSGTPLRIIVPKGQGDRAAWAARISHEVLERLETYFGMPYPFDKLDCLAMPRSSYGAMENPGLVTFAAQGLLQAEADDTIERRRGYAETAMHELAHQWFGNLVTMRWWDDVWLSEAFATWMTLRIVEDWQPTWGAAIARIGERSAAMWADALASARPIRRPVASYDDIETIYDAITYEKGATVIGMFERLVGPEIFRRGIHQYLVDHARGSADAGDFLAAISRAAGHDIAPAFMSFLDRPGTPVVSVALDCGGASPVLRLEQRRYRPLGSAPTPEQAWQIPVCVRWPDGHACTLLSTQRAELPLAGATACPAWVEPNDGGAGYYRVEASADLLARLEHAGLRSLTEAEKLSLLSDVAALAGAGALDFAAVLQLGEQLADDRSRHVVAAVLDTVAGLEERGLVTAAERPAYQRWLRRLFGARAHALGLRRRDGDDDDARLLRARLVPAFAAAADDRRLLAEARTMVRAWSRDHRAVEPDLVDALLGAVARSGDRALWEAWMKAARATRDAAERERLLAAIGQLRDPALVRRSLAVLEGDAFDPRDALALLWGATGAPQTRLVAWQWLQAHFDALAARLPRDAAVALESVPNSLCDDAMAERVRAFFAERAARIDGGAPALSATLEAMHLCAAARAAYAPSVARFFATR